MFPKNKNRNQCAEWALFIKEGKSSEEKKSREIIKVPQIYIYKYKFIQMLSHCKDQWNLGSYS